MNALKSIKSIVVVVLFIRLNCNTSKSFSQHLTIAQWSQLYIETENTQYLTDPETD